MLRQRELNAMTFLDEKSSEFPSVYKYKITYFSPVKLELETKSLFEEKKALTYNEKGVSYEEFFEQNIDSYDILAKDFL